MFYNWGLVFRYFPASLIQWPLFSSQNMPKRSSRYQQASDILEASLIALQQQGMIPLCRRPSREDMLAGERPVCELKCFQPTPLHRRCYACRKSASNASVSMHFRRSVEQFTGLAAIREENRSLKQVVLHQAATIDYVSSHMARWRDLFLRAEQQLATMVATPRTPGEAAAVNQQTQQPVALFPLIDPLSGSSP